MKLGLMIIDLQKAYYEGESKASMDGACEYINAVLPLFRKAGLPVLWVQHVSDEDGVVPGAEGFELIDALKPLEVEHRIHKTYGNSFNKTECAALLREQGVDTVVITGYCAEHCVLSSYRGAADQDFLPVILRNGIASGSAENKRFVENISNVLCYAFLKKMLEDRA
jgi:nicotinamidase-related amidase